MQYRIISVLMTFLTVLSLTAQTVTITGQVVNPGAGNALENITVSLNPGSISTLTDKQGKFTFENVQIGDYTLLLTNLNARLEMSLPIQEDAKLIDLNNLELVAEVDDTFAEIPVITLESDDFGQDNPNNISGLLTASRDIFVSATRFTWGTRRFRSRGLDNREQTIMVNGVSVNDLEFGRPSFWLWSGLNDVTRNGSLQYGIVPIDFSFGGLGGASELNVRASAQRKQLQASISLANISYSQRAMLTYGTGWLDNGWAFAASVSRRWSQEGYIEGTFYDAYGYYAAVSRKLNEQNQLHLTLMGAPNRRGKSAAVVQELYDLAGTNYYNPYWGYQVGKKRNSRIGHSNVPFVSLAHDFSIDNGLKLTTTVGYQIGTSGGTALDWFEARNPAPDYYRRLPSWVEDPELSDRIAAELRNNEELRQLDWASFYQANALNQVTIEDANGIEGNSYSGLQSQYIIEDRRYDTESLDFQSTLFVPLNESLSLQGGLAYRTQTKENFKLVEDLLGGEFYLDLDKFAVDDLSLGPDGAINDLDRGNRIAFVGDTIGYSYNTDIRDMRAWVQLRGESEHFDYFLGLTAGNNKFWRTGNFKNGKFPETSKGKSAETSFFTYGVKGGLTYKINGRNYIYLNGMTGTRAPFARNSFIAPRVRNDLIPNLIEEQLWGAEITYNWRSPVLKARASAYINEIKDQVETRGVFIDDGLQSAQGLFFGNYITSNLDSRHIGTELSAEVKLSSALSMNGTASLGQYFYTDRALVNISVDNVAELVVEDLVSYTKNFYVDGTPQSAYKLGFNYQGKGFWSVWLDFSYLDNLWLDYNTLRRSTEGISYVDGSFVEPGSQLWEDILHQEKGDGGFFVDLSIRKSFKIGDGKFIIGNIGINNLLNNQDFKSGGFEQTRFDYSGKDVDRFPTRYYYGLGRTYFINLTYRMN